MDTNEPQSKPLRWSEGAWTNDPAELSEDEHGLSVTARQGSDAWRHTSYGFVHDTEHALLRPIDRGTAVEVTFSANFENQFDQAGVFLRADADHWIKAGIEFVDGVAQLGAVVTNGTSDWSVAPAPGWVGSRVTMRLSLDGDAVTIRARTDEEPLRLIRLAPLTSTKPLAAGPFCCAPVGAGFTTLFRSWEASAADSSLHE